MSRIHEALKRAEQEQVIFVPPGLEPEPVVDPLIDLAGPSSQEPAASSPVPPRTIPSGILDSLPQAQIGSRRAAANVTRFDDIWNNCAQHEWTFSKSGSVFTHYASSSPIAEQFRTLRSRLYQIRDKRNLRSVLVTSSLPAEGKTFIASNLAHALARQENCKVLLIDADLRSSGMHTVLGAPSAPGLTDYLSGAADELKVIQHGMPEYLCFIPSGTPVPNPAELLMNGKLKSLLQEMGPVFDWVILDSPPTLPVADAVMLADLSDGVVNVVRAARTSFDTAQKSCRQLRDKNLLGIALNCSEEGASSIYEYPALSASHVS
jgi:capsular exopolysaccharide synthesis family protein